MQMSVFQQISTFKLEAQATQQLINLLQTKVAQLVATNQTASMQVYKFLV